MSEAIWDVRVVDDAAVLELATTLKLSAPAARVLAGRGITAIADGERCLSARLQDIPDPFLLKDMDRACALIAEHVRRASPIVAFGDYDMDGLSSLALIGDFFASCGFAIECVVPRRETEGYGLRPPQVAALKERGVGLLITLDNGISANEEIALAKSLGLDVIIVDHHQLGPELPCADAIVNPLRPDCPFADKRLAAVGLTFMLAMGLRRHFVECGLLTREKAPSLRELLDFVALGTVADLVPLVGLNRLFVRHGLPLLTRSHRVGILALKEALRLAIDAQVGAFTIGYTLVPPLNAAGRIGDPRRALALLGEKDLSRARDLAREMERGNQMRKAIELRVVEEALAKLAEDPELESRPALVVDGADWPEGVVGLVAARLVERFHKPAVVIAAHNEHEARGSCRSIRALHIQQALQAVSSHLQRFGGHSQAAGFSIDPKAIPAFREAFMAVVADTLKPEDYRRHQLTDGECPLSMIDSALIDDLERLAPFGASFAAPSFIARDVQVLRAMVRGERHLKLDLVQQGTALEAIGFNMAERAQSGDRLDIVYVPEYNTFRGVRTIQLRLLDIRPCL